MGASIPHRLDFAAPLDRRGRALRDLRISVIDRCNFRCPYCMPEDQFANDAVFLSKSERLRFEEIERIARAFVRLGVRKLRLTGGEPLLRRDLPQLVGMLRGIEQVEDIALTTNGVLLPRFAAALREAGLMRITVSLDTLDPQTFRTLSGGRGEVEQVLAGIAAAEAAGFERIKLNCVVMRGVNDAQVLDLVERFRGTGHIVRFIEYMDVGTLNHWSRDLVVPSAELLARIEARWPLRALEPNYRGEVAGRYALADGRMYTCLFASDGHDLRSALRGGASDDELADIVDAVWSKRSDRYSEQRAGLRAHGDGRKVEMFSIGG